MKLQSFGIIFVLIFLPLVLVLSYYIQLQVETIRIQNEYDNKLLSSTYDAISAFELNTANEDLSSVSDSLRTIIEASCNVFFNSLATNLGMSNASKSYIEPYVPALLYTLYDGYYIYAPTSVPTVLTDEDGNALSVGDLGVIKNGTNYGYDSTITDQNEVLEYDDLNNNQKSDYGQLLYEMDNGNSYTTNPDNAKYKTKNVLKTYMPYSAKYYQDDVNGKKVNIEVIYTLDNYVTIEGTVGDIYYTKSGYLIPTDGIIIETRNADGSPVTTEDNKEINILSYNENDAEKYISDGNPVQIQIKNNDGNIDIEILTNGDNKKTKDYEEEIISYKNNIETAEDYIVQLPILSDSSIDQTLKDSLQTEIEAFINSITKEDGTTYNIADGLNKVLSEIINDRNEMINDRQYEVDIRSAATYYIKAYIFSSWVEETFVNETDPTKGLMEKSLIQVSSYISMEDAQNTTQLGIGTTGGIEEIQYNFSDKTSNVFDVTNAETSYKNMASTEIPQDSAFYTHKTNVIRSSIQYNLNLAMTNYNYNKSAYDAYNMPVISEDEWKQLLSNVSLISFMQGYSCGLKTYNNYMIVSSTNNEISISPSNIYYLAKDTFNDETTEYHRIDCKKFVENSVPPATKVTQFLSFVSKEVKYDKLYDKTRTFLPYEYDHKNLACYDCINDGNYEKINPFDDTYVNFHDCDELRKAYYIAVGKSRNNLYKMNAITESQGYKVLATDKPLSAADMTKPIDLTKVKALEFVFGTVKFTDSNETAVRFEILLGGETGIKIHEADFSISQTANKTTVYVPIKTNVVDATHTSITLNDLFFKNLAANSSIVDKDGNPMELDKLLHNEPPSEVLEYVRVIYK